MSKKSLPVHDSARRTRLEADLQRHYSADWSISLPGHAFSLRLEDIIPALAGAIGKISLTAAFAAAWAKGLSIEDAGFITENVRLELVIGSLFLLLFSVFFHARLAPAGTLAPMIAMIPLMAAAGVHPLALGLLYSFFVLILAISRTGSRLVLFHDAGTKAGILILFSLMGLKGSLTSLWQWSDLQAGRSFFVLLLCGGLLLCLFLYRYKKAWMMIPLSLLLAAVLSALYGYFPAFSTRPGLPVFSGSFWWQEQWGIGYSLNLSDWTKALPFALLALLMLPLDAVAIRTMHQREYQAAFSRVGFKLNVTFLVIGLRNLAGTILGGAQLAAVWRSFLIPLGVVRRPIQGSALLLGCFGLGFALAGFPLDLAMYPPLLHLVLITGVFVPMLMTGLQTARLWHERLGLTSCVVFGLLVHPLAGWLASLGLRYLLQKTLLRSKA